MSTLSLEFHEQMKGFVTREGSDDYEIGFRLGQKKDTSCCVSLTIHIPNLDVFTRDPKELADITGEVECPLLGGKCTVEKGQFNLLVDVIPGYPGFKDLRYRLFIRNPNGDLLTFSGVKFVDNNGLIFIWRDTTKLFTKIFKDAVQEGEEDNAKLFAIGILHLRFLDFIKTLWSFRCAPPGFRSQMRGKWLYFSAFAKRLWQVYG